MDQQHLAAAGACVKQLPDVKLRAATEAAIDQVASGFRENIRADIFREIF